MSPTRYTRIGGAWVQSGKRGKVRFNGQDITYGPPSAGTVDEWLQMPDPLSQSDWADEGANVAVRFAISVPGQYVGIRFWQPGTLSATQYVYGVNGDAGTVITEYANTPAPPALGGWLNQMFVTPISIVPGVNYLAALRTNRYSFSRVADGATIPFVSTSGRAFTDGVVMSAVAFYGYGGQGTIPTSSSPNFHYNVSPIVRFPA